MAKKNNSSVFDDDSIPTNKSQDFASLFEESMTSLDRKVNVGDRLQGRILSIGKEESFIAIGGHQDGVMFNADLLDENKNLKYQVGDTIEIVVVKVRGDQIRVTRKGSKAAPADIENLEDAFDMELPVEGKVTEVVNGGFRVSIQGQSAFCPISQLDSKYTKTPEEYVGKKFDFLITQFDAKKRNIVVSRRKLLDAQKLENEGVWIEKNKIGDIVPGTVTRTEQFGAFVDLGGGVEGLVHVSELGFVRLRHASEAVQPGDTVQVKILKVDEEDARLRISLSVKQAGGANDPWTLVPQRFPVGAVVDGTVDKKEAFGLFVVLTPGINGLLPKSKWRDAEDPKLYENARKGDAIKIRIDEIKYEERKISLGLPTDAQDESWKEHQTASQGFGSFAQAFSQASVSQKKK